MMTETKVMKKLAICLVDYEYTGERFSIYYEKYGEERGMYLSKKDLLRALEDTFIIEDRKGSLVFYPLVSNFYHSGSDGSYVKEEQRTCQARLEDFMLSEFTTEDASKVLYYQLGRKREKTISRYFNSKA